MFADSSVTLSATLKQMPMLSVSPGLALHLTFIQTLPLSNRTACPGSDAASNFVMASARHHSLLL
jgi:hypothetical protein